MQDSVTADQFIIGHLKIVDLILKILKALLVLIRELVAGVIMTLLKLLLLLTHLVDLLIESLTISFETGVIVVSAFILFYFKTEEALVLRFNLDNALSGNLVSILRCIELGTNGCHLLAIFPWSD